MSTRFLAFLQGLDTDLKAGLQEQLRILWTHHSTALEGNTLTLGETFFVLSEGMTIGGKSLKDHLEVVGHARAIDLLTAWLQQEMPLGEAELFALHQAVQTQVVVDIFAPVGRWKVEPNGASFYQDGRLQFNDTYADPQDVPALMADWLTRLAEHRRQLPLSSNEAVATYVDLHASFVGVHPFADGNGRLARLLANIPVLEAGYPPLILPRERRAEYISTLAAWQTQVGKATPERGLLPAREKLAELEALCRDAWQSTLEMITEFQARQASRRPTTRLTPPAPSS